jgi:hypothetical protein
MRLLKMNKPDDLLNLSIFKKFAEIIETLRDPRFDEYEEQKLKERDEKIVYIPPRRRK